MKSNKLIWCLGLIMAASTCLAQSVIDQSFTGPYDNVWWLFYSLPGAAAQVYTAGITGSLTSVSISVEAQHGGPVAIEILDPSTGPGTAWPVLGYTMITPPPQVCNGTDPRALVSASFSPPVPQVAGKQYALAVFPTYQGQIWYGSSFSGSTRYLGGDAYYSGPASWTVTNTGLPSWAQIVSFYFQTYVKPSRKK